MLCGDRDKIAHYISEYSKVTHKKYKSRHDWMGKMIHWELRKRLEFDVAFKWNMYKPGSILENKTHKILWDFEIQTDLVTPTRRPSVD